MTFPNAILVGAQKSGTTSFFHWMSQHPQILAPYAAKEFHFFCHDGIYGGGPTAMEALYSEDKGAVVGLLGGVNHLYLSETAAQRIFQYRSDMKLIAILRDPVHQLTLRTTTFASSARRRPPPLRKLWSWRRGV